MKIVTWNVNSIKARLPIVTDWLTSVQPDVVLLQETKCQAEAFPREEIEDLGYNIEVVGQKSYNGVAILSKRPIEDAIYALPGDDSDEQARYIEAVIGDVRVASIYVPNGSELGSEKFAYKMDFLDRLNTHTQELLTYDEAFILGGDYNIAPADADVYDPQKWQGRLHCSLPERQKLRALMNLGLTDVTRAINPNTSELYSWWDYRSGSWQNNNGLRIDLLLASPQAADRTQASAVDNTVRGLPKASDHAPVWCTLG
ncbi:MAG: exodeoxyribonuclease III [Alphaproteobacteria bacterium]